MTDDERAIRELIATWMRASMAGDTDTVLSLMADDAVFMVAGQEAFGKTAFAAAADRMRGMRLEGTAEVRELQVQSSLAFSRTYLQVTMTPPSGRCRSAPRLCHDDLPQRPRWPVAARPRC